MHIGVCMFNVYNDKLFGQKVLCNFVCELNKRNDFFSKVPTLFGKIFVSLSDYLLQK